MASDDATKNRGILLDRTVDGRPIYSGDPCPTLYDRLPDGRPVYSTGPEDVDRH